MTVLCNVEQIPSHLGTWEDVEFSRVPCIGEYVFVDDRVFEVKAVFHPLGKKFDGRPIIRVAL